MTTEETTVETTEEKTGEQLPALIEAARTARLSPADEDRAAALLKEKISGGPKALPEALEAMTALSWAIGVKAVSEAWPELKPTGRTRLISSLAKMDSEAARRLRLSLARGLYAADTAAAQKLILGVCDAMFETEGGPTQRDRQTFANVLLGKAKPWLTNVAMGELKPAEAQRLVDAALEAAQFAPIFTQIWVLRWIADAEKFDAVSAERMEALAKAIHRWQPRWRKELRKLVAKLPPALEAVAGSAEKEGAKSESTEPADKTEPGEGEEPPHAKEPRPRQHQEQPRQQQQPPSRRDRQENKPHAGGAKGFDLVRALRDIENYVGRMQSEMQLLQVAARRPDRPDSTRGGGRQHASHQPPASSAELDELRRHNEQLEEQNLELRRQFEELAGDHEDRASTLAEGDAVEQFKTLLGLKLKEDFANYAALSRESLTEVVRQHAQETLGHIFAVLQGEGVRFE